MEAKVPILGASMPVPSVQELVKQPITKISERYVRQNLESAVVSNTSSSQVPVVDLSKLLSEDATELEKLDNACREWGFFQLINHGVDLSLVEDVKIGVEKFFNLPLEEKKILQQKPGELEGFGQLFVMSKEQKLEWADIFYMYTHPLHIRDPRLFPNIPQPFRHNLETYLIEMKNLCITIMSFMTKALKIKPNELLDLFEDIGQIMRINYYPPCPLPEHVIGLNPHSDIGALNMLLQVNETNGLQIRKDGVWIPVKPLPNAFVINAGDTLEILTNGIYRSIEHRATVNREKERISLVTFHRPDHNRVIGPIQSLITPERPAMFNRIGVADYYKGYYARELQGKSYIDQMRINSK